MMNFHTVTLGGETHPIAFYNGAFVRFQRRTGKPFFEALNGVEQNAEDLTALVLSGLECGAAIAKTENKIADPLELADRMVLADLPEIMEILKEYLPKPEPGESVAAKKAA